MNLESLKELDKKYAQVIADYLLKRIDKDEFLLNKMNGTDKTLKGCIDYIKGEARKQAQDGCAVLLDDEVFEMAVHYFMEDSIKETKPSDKTQAEIEAEEEEPEEIEEETLFGTEKIVVEKKKREPKTKVQKKQEIKVDLVEQLSLF